ncbi:MAG TPA: branched-chain amino acid ABC transporter permease [Dongiaceae bacterium]|nr:branched-chain amino acid ABC transporter permease [Dongiaceae bacterium]
MSRLELGAWALGVLVLVVLPQALSLFQLVQYTVFMIYALLALSLDFIWGIAGILSFGQAALFGIGGYVYGIVAINFGLTPLALLAGALAPAAAAGIIGYVAFYGRVGSMYFAVVTLTVTLILYQVMGSTADPRYAVGAAELGGYNGMTNIPSLSLAGPAGQPVGPAEGFYLAGGLLLLVLASCVALARSSYGRVLQGIRENERRMELLGYDVRWRKLLAFAISAAIAGLAGGLFASWGNFINPEVFSLPQAAIVVIWVLVGGRGSLWGAVLGTVLVQYLASLLGQAGATYTTVLLGVMLIAIVLLFRRGLAPALTEALAHAVRRRPGMAARG